MNRFTKKVSERSARTRRWTVLVTALAAVFSAGCDGGSITESEVAPSLARGGWKTPDPVTDLSVSAVSDSTVTLSWSQVSDGTGSPSLYQVRWASTPIGSGWGSATIVAEGGCSDPVQGTEIGTTLECTVRSLDPETSYDFQLVAFRAGGSWRVYSEISNVATGVTEATVVEEPEPEAEPESGGAAPKPAQVTDLEWAGSTDSSVSLTWTEVDDGAGAPASYQVRYAVSPLGFGWGSATVVESGSCASPVVGTEIGGTVTCAVEGLTAESSYDFQLVAIRESEAGTVYSELSEVVTGVTEATVVEEPEPEPDPEPDPEPEPDAVEDPAQVADLDWTGSTESSVSLTWTEVDDGTGFPATYQLRYTATPMGWGWGSATVVESGSCASPVVGTGIGNSLTCEVGGLSSGTSYDFQLVASRESEGGNVYSELSAVVTGVTESGDAGGGSGSGSGLNLTEISSRSFDLLEEDGWSAIDDPSLSIVPDLTAPASAPSVGQATFQAGFAGGYAPIWSDLGISSAGARTLKLSFTVKLSDNWEGHPSKVNKIGFVWIHGNAAVYFNNYGTGDGSLTPQVRLQRTAEGADGARNLDPNLSAVEIQRGAWHVWEVVLVSNTGDAHDGEVHFWIDGVKVGEYTDIAFGTSSQDKVWEAVTWRPVWGGNGDEVDETMHMWMDHFTVSGSP